MCPKKLKKKSEEVKHGYPKRERKIRSENGEARGSEESADANVKTRT